MTDKNVIGNSIQEYEESIFSIYDDKNKVYLAHYFVNEIGLFRNYLSLKVELNESVPREVFEKIIHKHIDSFKSGHANYNTHIREIVDMIMNNFTFQNYQDYNVYYFNIIATAIHDRNDIRCINDFIMHIAKSDLAYNFFYECIKSNVLNG